MPKQYLIKLKISLIIKIRGYYSPLCTYNPKLPPELAESGKFHLIPLDLEDTFLISYKILHWELVTNLILFQPEYHAECKCPGSHPSCT